MRWTIEGHPDYIVNDDGHVFCKATGQRLKGQPGNRVALWEDNSKVWLNIPHAVLIAFHGQPQDGQQPRHKDGDKTNNSTNNLEWR